MVVELESLFPDAQDAALSHQFMVAHFFLFICNTSNTFKYMGVSFLFKTRY